MTASYWGVLAREHWQRHLPRCLAELDDPDAFFDALEDEAQEYHTAIRNGLLKGLNPHDVEPGDGPGPWRIAQRTAPDRVISTVDPEARHVHKTRHAYRDGYTAHIAVEPDTGLVTDWELTAGNTGDAAAAPRLLDSKPAGTEVLGTGHRLPVAVRLHG